MKDSNDGCDLTDHTGGLSQTWVRIFPFDSFLMDALQESLETEQQRGSGCLVVWL